jgi:putative addiction module CopG family antidote
MENTVAMGNTSLNISLPEGLKAFVKERVAQAHYSTPSDYVRALIRADQKRQAKEKLDQLLLAGLETASEGNQIKDVLASAGALNYSQGHTCFVRFWAINA